MNIHVSFLTLYLFLFSGISIAVENIIPSSCYDNSMNKLVETVVKDTLNIYKEENISLPFQEVEINPKNGISSKKLNVRIIDDNLSDSELSCKKYIVAGACKAVDTHIIDCSAGAIKSMVGLDLDANSTNSSALLYLMAHEIAHLHQKHRGSFVEQIAVIDLSMSTEEKNNVLKKGCNVLLNKKAVKKEREADDLALKVLKNKMQDPDYIECAFSKKGAIYWNLDKIRFSTNNLQNWSAQQAQTKQSLKVHQVFDPDSDISYPVEDIFVTKSAKKFVCDVMTKKEGKLIYPLRQKTHPSAPERLNNISILLSEQAELLEDDDNDETCVDTFGLKPLTDIQKPLAQIFSFIDQGYASYFKRLHSKVCSIANAQEYNFDCSKLSSLEEKNANVCDYFEVDFLPEVKKLETEKIKINPENNVFFLSGEVSVARFLTENSFIVGLNTPKRVGIWKEGEIFFNAYKINCTPVDGLLYKGELHVLCKDPFSILEIKENGEAIQLNFTRGSWARDETNIDSQTISPLWLGTINDTLIASIDLPSGNGTSFTFSKSHGKTLDALYKDQQCQTINPALSYWELGKVNPYLVGTTLNNNASLIVAGFDKNLKKIQNSFDMNDPEIPDDIDLMDYVPPSSTLSCAPSFSEETMICVDEEGGLFTTSLEGERKNIGNFTPHNKLHEISICGTGKGVHLLSTTMDGLGPAEFFRINSEGKKVTLYKTDVNSYAHLSCTKYGAVAVMNDWVNSFVVRE